MSVDSVTFKSPCLDSTPRPTFLTVHYSLSRKEPALSDTLSHISTPAPRLSVWGPGTLPLGPPLLILCVCQAQSPIAQPLHTFCHHSELSTRLSPRGERPSGRPLGPLAVPGCFPASSSSTIHLALHPPEQCTQRQGKHRSFSRWNPCPK